MAKSTCGKIWVVRVCAILLASDPDLVPGKDLFTSFPSGKPLEKLIKPWMDHAYKFIVTISLILITISPSGDAIQLGTTIPFFFTIWFTLNAVYKLAKRGRLRITKDFYQLVLKNRHRPLYIRV